MRYTQRTLQSVRYNQHLYQQDGASIHWALTVRELLNNQLENRWIGRSGSIEWPPRSSDLTTNDFWLWSHMRNTVYKNPPPQSLQELTIRCEEFLENINLDMVKNAFNSFKRRCQICFENQCEHFEQFL